MITIEQFLKDRYQQELITLSQNQSDRYEEALECYKNNFLAELKTLKHNYKTYNIKTLSNYEIYRIIVNINENEIKIFSIH